MNLRPATLFFTAALGWGCTAPSAPRAPATPSNTIAANPRKAAPAGRKRMMRPGRFVPGPTIRPSTGLVAWLKKSGRRRVRLPVVIRFGQSPLRNRKDAFVGASPKDLGPDAVFLKLEDGAMGISLRTRLRSRCPRKRDWCAVWLEGTWGPLLPRPLPGGGAATGKRGAPWPFSVRRVAGTIGAPTNLTELRAQVQAPAR